MAKKTIEQHGAADFDWDALALDGYSHIQRSELSDKYEQTLTSINEKEVVEGTVVLVTKKEVIINIGFKSEGVVAASDSVTILSLRLGTL